MSAAAISQDARQQPSEIDSNSDKTSLAERVAALEAQQTENDNHQFAHKIDQRLNVSGFGSFTLSQLSEDASEPSGRDNQLSIDPYSLFGLELAFIVTPSTRAVLQLVAEANEDFDPEFEWLYVEQNFSDKLRLQLGRFGYAAFSESQNAKVAYSYPAVSLTDEVYVRTLIESADGASLAYDMPWGDSLNTWHIYAGERSVDKKLEALTIEADKVYGSYLESFWRAWYFRVAAHFVRDGHLLLENIQVPTGFQGCTQPSCSLKLDLNNDQYSLAAKYQGIHWYMHYELSFLSSENDRVGDILGQGLTVAYEFEQLQPYLQWGYYQTNLPDDQPAEDLNGKNTERQQQSLSLGIRHNFADYVSMKYQLKYLYDFDQSNGIFNYYGTEPIDFDDAWAFDISLQFVFDESL
ncbi:MAG: hypothetical protein HRU21_03950 [Pseudomonadales bacterium]|nr:hypothetical protein [Pseudomonadales bacterium]